MKRAPRQTSRQGLTAPIRRVRFAYVVLGLALWSVLIVLRLVWLQVVRHSDFVERAARQQERTFEVAPRRGVLYDRNLRELGMTVLVDSVYAVPSELGENRANAAMLLAGIVHQPQDSYTSQTQILARLNASRNFAWVARRLDPDTATRVRELNLRGVYFQKEFKRFYPNNDLAAQVLGYVGTDDTGLGGLEREFDDDMHGEPGHVLTQLDAKRHVLGSEENQPQAGENLVLSIDANIQYMAERALDAQMAKVKALHGTVVVQDPHTGQILALAISPRFNPNDSRHMDAGALTNLAVSDIYEPGSTFKLVTYAAALDAAGVQPTDMVDCQGGAMTMFGRTLHDDRSDHFGVVTVQYALEHSSDVGAAKMALKLGSEKFYHYIKGFGFGDRSGIELPSETRGLLSPPKRWGATSILSLAIGQEIGVTPVQLVTMVSAIANGGVYMPPHVLLESTDEMKGDARLTPIAFHPENQLPATLPDGAHRVITELTSAKMRSMMQGIVTEGTGRQAALNGYSSAGKTGTAQKIDPATRTYSHTKLVASFAGFAPVSNPAIAVAVVIDTPTAGSEVQHYGGAVSAPVFAEVAQQVLEYLGVPHDQPLKPQKLVAQASDKDDLFNGSADDNSDGNAADLAAMFAEVNNLPADDPLRAGTAAPAAVAAGSSDAAAGGAGSGSGPGRGPLASASSAGGSASTAGSGDVGLAKVAGGSDGRASGRSGGKSGSKSGVLDLLPESVLSSFRRRVGTGSAGWNVGGGTDEAAALPTPNVAPPVQVKTNGAVVVDAGHRVAVPSFEGAALRTVVEEAGRLGLKVEPVGSGLARQQVPAAGTMVPLGTEVAVRFSR